LYKFLSVFEVCDVEHVLVENSGTFAVSLATADTSVFPSLSGPFRASFTMSRRLFILLHVVREALKMRANSRDSSADTWHREEAALHPE